MAVRSGFGVQTLGPKLGDKPLGLCAHIGSLESLGYGREC